MNLLEHTFRSEKGVALALALVGLVMLTGLLLTFMSISAMEPSIATNLTDVTQARYVADAGIESAYDQLAASGNWNAVLLGPDGLANTPDDGELVAAGTQLPGLGNTFGAFFVTVRNDNQPADSQITGRPVDPGNATTDTNGVLIVTAAGTSNGVNRQIQVVVSQVTAPPPPGAVSCAGVRCDFDTGTIDQQEGAHFHSDGRDYNRDGSLGTGPLKFALSVPPGDSPAGQPYEQEVEASLNNHQLNEMDGLDGATPGQAVVRWTDQGHRTIAPSTDLTSQGLASFLQKVKASGRVNVFETPNDVQVESGVCSADPGICGSLDLGTVQNPTLTYIKGTKQDGPVLLKLYGTNAGAGLLIVEEGSIEIRDTFRWDGLIVVSGKDAGVWFKQHSRSFVYGGFVLNETQDTQGKPTLMIEQNLHGDAKIDQFTAFYSSQQNIDMANTTLSGVVQQSSWREL